ncbi:synapse-associated protein of 47 kDa isoform X2 [Daktulosphaira vitifoliae]|uniref:synapse-associated protein of 47 kDa isoform X2 n=2 Tax=Daktulosphaira vitifoliae TaxID=58002 RepID=UPI0021A9DCE0|nr:synapse-associated protein of 47 kDa isoform X2 [Daktulosphaira vitifoliae]
MFNGITSQVSSWIGKKQEDVEETVPSPKTELPEDIDNKPDISPTKPPSKLEMLGNVKNQMSSWLGSGISGLRKSDSEVVPDPPAELLQEATDESKEKEDDNSSATGDPDTPVSETEDDLGTTQGNVSNKALQGAKSFGNFLYSAVNKAGKTVSEAGAKIKKTVGDNGILGELNKEQESFLKDKKDCSIAAVPPWVGHPNEEAVKAECLSLSTDRRNFVRSPPVGVDFNFDYTTSYPIALSILSEDPNLEKMRFDLVPKIINEESFWQNYFYRVNLICNANNLETLDTKDYNATSNISMDLTDSGDNASHNYVKETEFVSDTFAVHDSKEINEIRESLKKSLGVNSSENALNLVYQCSKILNVAS